MKITKIVGFTCAALLLFLLVGWVGDTLYSTSSTAHGHGDEEHKAGYVIEVVEAAPGAEDAVEIPFAEYYAAADAAKGEKVFSKCSACHKLDGSDGVGPHLDGIVDASVARSAGYAYSGGMAAFGGNWNAETLNTFLTRPKDMISDTKMSFPGLKKPEDRANLIAYLAAN